jgi:glycosyltransferase involved in cell wall biosynthesis
MTNDPVNCAAPRISVVVPTRNRLDWLMQCLASVQSQEAADRELIVVDDASGDGTTEWLESGAAGPVRLHRFESPRERCAARNQGLAMARGRYIMFLDDDDWLWPGALAVLSGALDREPAAVASVGARWAVFAGENYERRDAHPRRMLRKNVLDELLFGWSAVSGQNLYRTAIVRSVGGYEDESLIPCEDRLLWYRIAMRGEVVLVPHVVMSYRYHAAQSRPRDIRSLRNRVARRAIRSLPESKRRAALRLRRSGCWIEEAEEHLSKGNPLRAIGPCARALTGTPAILRSPLIGEWVLRRLAGRLYRRLFPAAAE